MPVFLHPVHRPLNLDDVCKIHTSLAGGPAVMVQLVVSSPTVAHDVGRRLRYFAAVSGCSCW